MTSVWGKKVKMNSLFKVKREGMNRIVFIVVFALMAWLAGSATAESPKDKRVKTLLDYRSELSLTDQQVGDIRSALASYQTTVTQQRQMLRQYEAEYSQLVAVHAPLEQIKQKLRQVTDTGFQLRYADILTSRKVESILSDQQLSKWREIQAKVRVGTGR